MGEGGFGPPKLKSNRFTVCPLWPLGNSPIQFSFLSVTENGAGGRTRTPDLLITNQLLYQLSYTSAFDYNIISHLFGLVKCFFEFSENFFCCPEQVNQHMKYAGRGDRTRTCGILVPNQALYQTELRLGLNA